MIPSPSVSVGFEGSPTSIKSFSPSPSVSGFSESVPTPVSIMSVKPSPSVSRFGSSIMKNATISSGAFMTMLFVSSVIAEPNGPVVYSQWSKTYPGAALAFK